MEKTHQQQQRKSQNKMWVSFLNKILNYASTLVISIKTVLNKSKITSKITELSNVLFEAFVC